MTRDWRPGFLLPMKSRGLSSPSAAVTKRCASLETFDVCALPLGDRDILCQIDVLNRVQQRDAFLDRTLERFTARDQTHPARALVDDRGLHGLLQIALSCRRSA